MGVSLIVPVATVDVPWTNLTLLNGWTWYGSEFPVPAFMRRNGIVYLRGLLKHSAPVVAQIMATLPAGCRPAGQTTPSTPTQMHIDTNSNNADGSIGIHATGDIQFKGGSGLWFSFDGLSFVAEQ